MRAYLIVDESRFDHLTSAEVDALFAAEEAGTVEPKMVAITWAELAAANDAETMDEIALLEVGQSTTLGQCDHIERIEDCRFYVGRVAFPTREAALTFIGDRTAELTEVTGCSALTVTVRTHVCERGHKRQVLGVMGVLRDMVEGCSECAVR